MDGWNCGELRRRTEDAMENGCKKEDVRNNAHTFAFALVLCLGM